MAERKDGGAALAAFGAGALGAALTALFMARPAKAAPTDEKLDYLLQVLTTLAEALAVLSARQAALIETLEKWEPGVAEWKAKEPKLIFDQAIRNIGVFNCDRLADWRNGKRLIIKVESSLDVAANIQPIGNIDSSFHLVTNIDGPFGCPANGNISIGFAWDDWQPFVGVTIATAVAPTTGRLSVEVVVQE